jgi:hypothetical protein
MEIKREGEGEKVREGDKKGEGERERENEWREGGRGK